MKDFKVYIIPLLYVVSSFISIKLNSNTQGKKKNDNKDENKDSNEADTVAQMNKSMLYIMPIMTVSIAFIAPLGLALYWFMSNVLMIGERIILQKILDNKED
jgi:YidC/Oxa1 family membrane protein insertase